MVAVRPSSAIAQTRLREIEVGAAMTRRQAEDAAASFGFDRPSIYDLALVAAGPVAGVPNLTNSGRRLAGCLDCAGAAPRVYFEAYDPPNRQRFSVAHEVGHFILHEYHRGGRAVGCAQQLVDPEITDDGDMPFVDEEGEANAFAAAFLIPAESLRDAVARFGFGRGFLAEHFGVSRQALLRRWSMLQEIDG